MLKFDKNSKKYETTEKGREYVEKYNELEILLRLWKDFLKIC